MKSHKTFTVLKTVHFNETVIIIIIFIILYNSVSSMNPLI